MALREAKNLPESFGPRLCARSFVPLIDPETGEVKVFKDQKSVRYAKRLQAHRPDRDDGGFRGDNLGQAQCAITADRVQAEPDGLASRGLPRRRRQLIVVEQDHIAALISQFLD